MTSLQQSFSEISRLVDEVAVPRDLNGKVGNGYKNDVERLRLTILTEGEWWFPRSIFVDVPEESEDIIKTHFESLRQRLEGKAPGDQAAAEALKKCVSLFEKYQDTEKLAGVNGV